MPHTTDTVRHRFDTPVPVELTVDLGRGSLRVAAAETGETEVLVSGEQADEASVGQHGEQVRVRAPHQSTGFRRSGHLDVEVRLPMGSTLAVRTASASVDVTGHIDGGRLRTASGSVSIESTSGPMLVESGSGDVEIREATDSLRVKSGSGDVVIGHAGSAVAVSAGSGDIRVVDGHGAVGAKTGSGDLYVVDARGDVSLHSGSGDLVVGTLHGGSVTARGASGGVEVGIPRGTPVWTDINTMSGRIDSDLAGVGEPAPGQDHVEVRATLVSGDVRLRQR